MGGIVGAGWGMATATATRVARVKKIVLNCIFYLKTKEGDSEDYWEACRSFYTNIGRPNSLSCRVFFLQGRIKGLGL